MIKSATDFPAYGQARTSNELRKSGVFVSPSGVRSIWLRHDPANFKTRLKALEAKVAADGGILTEAQVQALEKKKLDDEACGEIETAHPGYPGSQDWRLHYAVTLKLWHDSFMARKDEVEALYDAEFVRMWRYYLKASEMTFRYGRQAVFQMQFSRQLDTIPLTRRYLYP